MQDLISRQAAIDAIENIDWYHQKAKAAAAKEVRS